MVKQNVNEERYYRLFNNAMLGITISDFATLKVIECNQKFVQIMGAQSKKECMDYINTILNSGLLRKYKKKFIKEGKVDSIEIELHNIKNKKLWLEFSAFFDKKLNLIECVITDITEKKETINELKRIEIKYQMIIKNIASIFWVMDKNGRYTYFSDNVESILGYTGNEVKNNQNELWLERIHENDIDNVIKAFDAAYSENKRLDIEYRIKNKEGKWLWINRIGERIIDENGEVFLVGVSNDITEKRNAIQKEYFALVKGEEKERSRIAMELHDGVSPILSAIKLYLNSFMDTNNVEKRKELAKKMENVLDDAIQSISEISNNISPHILKNFGLSAAVQTFVEQIKSTSKIFFSLFFNINEEIDENYKINTYRIVTELIQNTLKHANAKKIVINLSNINNKFNIYFEHDGKGFNVDLAIHEGKGMGLYNIYNRVNALNGTFNMISSENIIGLKVEIEIPLQ